MLTEFERRILLAVQSQGTIAEWKTRPPTGAETLALDAMFKRGLIRMTSGAEGVQLEVTDEGRRALEGGSDGIDTAGA